MSLLSEKKKKTNWVVYPKKKPLWMTDSDGIKFGKKIMEQMGWSVGEGLGINGQGIQEPLRVSYKNDKKGMGFKGNDDDWIDQQDEFNVLLSQLRNSNDCFVRLLDTRSNEMKSLEEKSKWSKARVHYQKFTRGKDLSKYSENDLACILGTSKAKKEKSKTGEFVQTLSKIDGCTFDTDFGVKTINSGSIQDYFKKKWNFLKNSLDTSDKDCQRSSQNFPWKKYSFLNEEKGLQVEDEEKHSSEKNLNFEATITLKSNEKSKTKRKKKPEDKNYNSEVEPEIKKKKINDDIIVNDISVVVADDLNGKEKGSKDLLVRNENDSFDVVKSYKRDHYIIKSNEELDVFIRKKINENENHSFQNLLISEKGNNVTKNNMNVQKKLKDKKEILKQKQNLGNTDFYSNQNHVRSDDDTGDLCFLKDTDITGKINNKEENYSKTYLILNQKREKSKKEKKKPEKKDNSSQDFCDVSNKFVNKQYNEEGVESYLEVECTKKKKKKSKKEKFIRPEEVTENCINHFVNFYEENLVNGNENKVTQEVKLLKKKKNKKELGKVKLQFVKHKDNQIIEPSLEVDIISTSEKEDTSKVELTKKKEKKKKEEKEKKENYIKKDVDKFRNCDNYAMDIKKKRNSDSPAATEIELFKKKKEREKFLEEIKNEVVEKLDCQTPNSYLVDENVESMSKKKTSLIKGDKKESEKEKVLEKDEMLKNSSTQNNETNMKEGSIKNISPLEVTLEIDSVKKKKKKDRKEKLLKEEEITDVTDDILTNSSVKKNKYCSELEKINSDKKKYTQEKVLVKEKKEEKKNKFFSESLCENEKSLKNKDLEKDKTETAIKNVDFINKHYFLDNNVNFYYYYNYCNKFSNVSSSTIDEESGVKSHKALFFNDKRTHKFYPGERQKKNILMLFHWADFNKFKGSNLEMVMGYGFKKEFSLKKCT